jgi:hypothetical protein
VLAVKIGLGVILGLLGLIFLVAIILCCSQCCRGNRKGGNKTGEFQQMSN